MASAEILVPIEEPIEKDTPDENGGDSQEPKSEADKDKPTDPSELKNTPSKRPSTSNGPKRAATTATSRTSKPVSASARAAPGSTLTKPPIRPTGTTTTRRPPSSGTPATTGSHRSRVSIGSSADERASRITTSGDENRRPAVAKRMSLTGTSTRAPLKPTPLGSDRKVAATPPAKSTATRTALSTTQSPSKSTPRSSATVQSTGTRTTRPTTTGRVSISSSDLVKRRVAPQVTPVGKRRSTEIQLTSKSPELQKRITEYGAIKAMLLAAIAADEAGEGAKRDEIQTDIDSAVSKLKDELEIRAHDSTNSCEPDKVATLKAQLEESGHKLAELQKQLDESLKKSADLEKSADEGAAAVQAEHSTQISNMTELHSQEIKDWEKKLAESEVKYQELAAQSAKDLETLKSSVEAGDARNTALLEEQKADQQASLEKLESQLSAELSSNKELSSQIETLKSDIAARTGELDTLKDSTEKEKLAVIETQQGKVSQLENELRGQNTVMNNLKDEIQLLKDSKDKEFLEAQESYSQKVAALEDTVALLEEKLSETEANTARGTAETTGMLTSKDMEIQRLGKVIEDLQNRIQELHEAKSDEHDKKVMELGTAHERALAALKAEHDSTLATLAATHEQQLAEVINETKVLREAKDKELASLTKGHESSQAEHEAKVSELVEIKSRLAAELDSLKITHQDDLQVLQNKLFETETALADSKQSQEETKAAEKAASESLTRSLEDKIQTLETQLSESNKHIQILTDDLKAEKSQVEGLQKGLEAFEVDSKGKDDHHDAIVKKLTTEIDTIAKSLEEKTSELSLAEEKHSATLNDLSAAHHTTLEALKVDLSQSHEGKLKELQAMLGEVSVSKSDLETSHVSQIQLLKDGHAAALGQQAAKLTALEETHRVAIENLIAELEDAQTKKVGELETSYFGKLKDLETTHAKAIEELLAAHEIKIEHLKAEHHASVKEDLAAAELSHSSALATVQQELSKAQEAAADTSAVDRLKEKLAGSASQLAKSEQEKADIESLLQSTKSSVSQLEALVPELESTKAQLSTANENLTQLKHTHELAIAEVQKLKADVLEANTKAAKVEATFTDFEKNINALSEKNITLIEQLQEAETSAAKGTRRIRDLEFDLAEAAKQLSNGNSSQSKGGLAESKWAIPDEENKVISSDSVAGDSGPATTEGEDLGSSIQGTMASIQEQLRQLEDEHEDMLDESARIVNMLSKTNQGPPPCTTTEPNTAQAS
ncbi:hypothetical protein LOZ12_002605 [Ophidiomyces ophidiicola]|uniref:Uncharacterized protein n=1 Tax=Ophidiomyces ophidiicola TaxID=1387563 RepID=A0ACB8V5U0_9EURO|nr:hypothetical protein LOZ64_002928 [Ophidiomyces ophidiicola]KAI1954673.1 hypothetical protein LOZ62_000688 [Ophidiomyces ophidiicola]KAI1958515.1 hypothetical protein LOZ59_003447 [Ophidiomyces ophidiicola]KAI2007573.1 hypothetical protein LOZ50_002449 [Ophidiomyces ophidiicola]KAI2017983.1 hypothetical protein LOZ46_004155 [Ophidiomyces ophidiicola]